MDKLSSMILLYCIPLYFTQGFFFPSGGVISQTLVLIWILIDLYYVKTYFTSKSTKSALGNVILFFWISNIVYWYFSPRMVSNAGLTFSTFGDFKNLTIVSLAYFPFLILSNRNYINIKWLEKFVFLLLGAAIIAFFVKQNYLQLEYGIDMTNNVAYYFVIILPFVGCYTNKKISFIFFAIIFIFLMLCAKRGAIICAFISLLIFILKYLKANKKVKFSRIFGILILVLVIVHISNTMLDSSELLQRRLEATREGDSSARDYIYSSLWNIFKDSPIETQIFGHGMSQTVVLIGGYAHNDWLELLTNNGIFGFLAYLSIFVTGIIKYFKSKIKETTMMHYIFLTSLLCLLARSMFSMGYLAPESALFFAGLAINLKGKPLFKIRTQTEQIRQTAK